jgi:ABC-type amino acid transport substrate-binding protein
MLLPHLRRHFCHAAAALLLLGVLLAPTAEAAAFPKLPPELRVAVLAPPTHLPAPPPGMPSGSLSALDEDLVREICRRLQVACRIEFRLFAEILPAVEAGQADLGLSNFQQTPERLQRVAFSAPLWRSSSRLVGRSKGSLPGQRLEKLHGALIAAVSQSQQHRFLLAQPSSQQLRVLEVATIEDGLEAVRRGRAAYCLVPMFNAYALLAADRGAELTFVGPPLTGGGLGGTVHIALTKGNEPLRQAVDQALLELRRDGTFARLMRRHFPVQLD